MSVLDIFSVYSLGGVSVSDIYFQFILCPSQIYLQFILSQPGMSLNKCSVHYNIICCLPNSDSCSVHFSLAYLYTKVQFTLYVAHLTHVNVEFISVYDV